ncbi:hypothetical protein BGZ91_008874 [Linnemannia elongata]|nr:hypothetical protein BGZ91_008874 [Linnemannia elongata]
MYPRQELYLPKSLVQPIPKPKLLTDAKVRYFGKHIVEDVRVIHRNNVTHCNLNPENVLVSEGMVLKILGFESSIHDSLRSTFIGTVGFTGTEDFKKEGHTTGMVVFSIGNIIVPATGKLYKRIRGSKNARKSANWTPKIESKKRMLIIDPAPLDFVKDEFCPTVLF